MKKQKVLNSNIGSVWSAPAASAPAAAVFRFRRGWCGSASPQYADQLGEWKWQQSVK